MTDDIIGDAIGELETLTMEKVKDAMKGLKGVRKVNLANELGKIITDGKCAIKELDIKDHRVDEALGRLEDTFVLISQGKDPFIHRKEDRLRPRIIIEGKSMHDMTKEEQEEIWRLSKQYDVYEKDINDNLWRIIDWTDKSNDEPSDLILAKSD